MQYIIEISADPDPLDVNASRKVLVDARLNIPDSLLNVALEEGIAVVAAETAGFFHRGISAAVMAVNDAKSRPSSRLQHGVDLPLPQSVIDEIQRKTGLRVAGATIIDLGPRGRSGDPEKANEGTTDPEGQAPGEASADEPYPTRS